MKTAFNSNYMIRFPFISKAIALLILFLINSLSVSSQTTLEKTVVSSKTKQPLPFVHVYIKNSGNGTYSDMNGQFQLNCHPEDIITLSSIGFKTINYYANTTDNDTLYLSEEVNLLNEVVVSTKKEKPIFEEIGFHNNKRDGSFIGSNAVALLVDNKDKKYGYISKVFINLSRSKAMYKGKKPEFHETLIRLRLLENNNGKITPEKDLLTKDILYRVGAKEKGIEFDISNQNLQFPNNGLFIMVEFVGFYKKENFIPFSSDDPNRIDQFKAAFSDNHREVKSWLKKDHYQEWKPFNLGIAPQKNFNFGLEIEQ